MIRLNHLKDVLIGITQDTGKPSSAMAYGLALAAAAGAHASIVVASAPEFWPLDPLTAEAAVMLGEENARHTAAAAKAAVDAQGDAQAAGVPCSVELSDVPLGNVIGLLKLRARLHDLCVLDAVSDPAVMLRDYIEAVLFESGRPVIVVPAHVPDFALDRVVVAWDGSAQAARALNDSLPLLRAAGTIEVVCVAGETEMSKTMPGSDIAPHLVRHGLNAEIVELPMGPSDAAATMMAYAGNVAADLIVMGAYRHSRIQEWVLGGMTRSLLSSPPAPLFIAH